jgi:hypothetical protein
LVRSCGPDFVAQLRGKVGEEGEHLVGCSDCRSRCWSNAMRNDQCSWRGICVVLLVCGMEFRGFA